MGKGDGRGEGSGEGKGQGHGEGSGEGKGQGHGDGSGAYKGKQDRIAVPAMPMPGAIVCCVLNFLIPGFGTIAAGFSNFCCSRNEDIDNAARFVSCLISWGIGCAQLITAVFCLFGFCWSWAWGIFMIGMSAEYYHNNRVEDTDRGRVVTHQPTAVVVSTSYHNQSTIRQPAGQQFGGQVLQIGQNPSVFQTQTQYSKPENYSAPPPYPGPPGNPTEAQLYPAGSAFPGTSNPAFPPPEPTKAPL